MDECLEKVGGLCEKGTREVFEPNSQVDFTEWQAKYVLVDEANRLICLHPDTINAN